MFDHPDRPEAPLEDRHSGGFLSAAPLLPVAIGLILGIILDAHQACGATVYVSLLAAALLALPLSAGKRWLSSVLLICGFAACGALLHDGRLRHLPSHHIARYTSAEPTYVTLQGQIVAAPLLLPARNVFLPRRAGQAVATRFLLAVHSAASAAKPMPLQGLVRVTVKEAMFDLRDGDPVRVFGLLYRPPEPANPGQFNWARYLRRQGIFAGLSCHSAAAIEKLPAGAWCWRRWLSRLRLEARTRLLENVLSAEADQKSLLDAMILGQRAQIDADLKKAFRKTGTAHFLALSGLHVGMLGMFLWLVCRTINLSRHAAAWMVLLVLCFYALVVEPSPSVFRATIIAVIFCLGLILYRPVNSLNNISAAAVLLLVIDPLQIHQAGFQLSFLVTLGIVYVTPALMRPPQLGPAAPGSMPGTVAARRSPTLWSYILWRCQQLILRGLPCTCAVCLAAWLVGTPLSAYHFNQVFTYGWLFSALLLPFVALVMFSGFAKLLLGLLWPSSAALGGPLLEWSTDALIRVIHTMAQVPAATVDVPKPPCWWLILYYVALATVVAWRHPQRILSGKIQGLWAGLVVGLVLLLAVPGLWRPPGRGVLRITVLAVGAGSATIVELPNGRCCLYDAGTAQDFDVGAHCVVPALRQLGIGRVDAAIISHANFDHYSGLLSLSDNVGLGEVIVTPYFAGTATPGTTHRRLLDGLRQRGIAIRQLSASGPARLRVPGLQAEVLWPPVNLPPGTAANERSLVIRMHYAGRRVLLTGDIEEYAQQELLRRGVDLRAEVLMLPHHGSVTPLTARFLDAVDPTYVVRSSNQRRRHQPTQIERLCTRFDYRNTADVGAITITLRPQELSVAGFRR